MRAVGSVLDGVLSIYLLVLMFRLVMDFVFQFSRSYRPRGAMLFVLEVVYTLTDPPLKLIRRIIPPLRLGGIAIDLAFLVLIFLLYALRLLVRAIF